LWMPACGCPMVCAPPSIPSGTCTRDTANKMTHIRTASASIRR
jgi:hypothetical protein